jgi:hypothetical protein
MEILFSFLVWASSFSQVDEESGSKMDTHNLATVITPNILKEKSAVVGQDENSFLAIEVINTLIEYNDEMCLVSLARRSCMATSNPSSRFQTTSSPFSWTPPSSTTPQT